MTAHGVAHDGDLGGVELRELLVESGGKFFGDVAVHLISLVVWCFCGVDVETGAGAEVPVFVFTFDV